LSSRKRGVGRSITKEKGKMRRNKGENKPLMNANGKRIKLLVLIRVYSWLNISFSPYFPTSSYLHFR
ncbi:MAG: hypothetical protein ABIG69_16605, partial [Bacteroidota bacterium]